MGRKPKFNKEAKIKACKDYDNGIDSFSGIADDLGANAETVRRWYLTYKKYGPDAFETSSKNQSYSKMFKISVVEEYSKGQCSLADISAKYKIATGVILNWVKKWYNGIEIKDYDPNRFF